jgi:SAM-dependent methyltransferase
MSKKIYEMNEEEMHQFIQKHLPIKKIEKDKYGEVFTSPILIQKMLKLFPKSVWSNHTLKWLDPSVGAGFFMIIIYRNLMNGLKKWEPNEKKRSKHIIENMLYMVEINKQNCAICKGIFGNNVNIICNDFLKDIHFKNNTTSFDCIIGNPPFQDDYGLSPNGKRINGGKSKLYERIFLKSYNILNNKGHLSFIVPDNIFSGNGSESYKIILKNDIPFVSFNPSNQSFFQGIQQPICYFMLHKTNNAATNSKETIIEHSDTNSFKIVLKDRPVNPIRNWTLHTEKLVNKYIGNDRNIVRYNRGKSLNSYKGNNYTIVYTPSKTLSTNNEKLAPGIGVKKAIIFAISPELEFKMDYSGKFGVGPNTFYVPFNTNSEGKRLETFLNSDDYKTLALSTKTTRQYLKIAFIEHLKLTKIMGQHVNRNTRKNKKSNKKTRKNNYKGGNLPQFNLDILVACHCIANKTDSKLYTHYKHEIEPFDETIFKNVKYIDTDNMNCIQSSKQYTNWNSITEQFDIIYAIHCPIYSLEDEVDIEISNGVYEDVFNNGILKPNGKFVIYAPDEEALRNIEESFNHYLQSNNLNPNSFYFMDYPYEDYVYNTPAVYSVERPDFVIEIMKK